MVLEFVKSFDFNAKNLNFIKYNGKTSHKTILGGILFISTSILLICLISIEVYNFLNQKLNVQSNIIPSRLWEGNKIFHNDTTLNGWILGVDEIHKKFFEYYRLVHIRKPQKSSDYKERKKLYNSH